MKRFVQVLWASLIVMIGLGSCAEDVDLSAERRELNEKNFATFASNTEYQKASLPGLYGDYFIYMKYLERGEESASKPKATDKVRIHYKLYTLTSFLSDSPVVIDSNLTQEVSTLKYNAVSSFVSGFQIALQNMKVGDKVGVAIPWYLAYGSQATASFPSYSALYFEITLYGIE